MLLYVLCAAIAFSQKAFQLALEEFTPLKDLHRAPMKFIYGGKALKAYVAIQSFILDSPDAALVKGTAAGFTADVGCSICHLRCKEHAKPITPAWSKYLRTNESQEWDITFAQILAGVPVQHRHCAVPLAHASNPTSKARALFYLKSRGENAHGRLNIFAALCRKVHQAVAYEPLHNEAEGTTKALWDFCVMVIQELFEHDPQQHDPAQAAKLIYVRIDTIISQLSKTMPNVHQSWSPGKFMYFLTRTPGGYMRLGGPEATWLRDLAVMAIPVFSQKFVFHDVDASPASRPRPVVAPRADMRGSEIQLHIVSAWANYTAWCRHNYQETLSQSEIDSLFKLQNTYRNDLQSLHATGLLNRLKERIRCHAHLSWKYLGSPKYHNGENSERFHKMQQVAADDVTNSTPRSLLQQLSMQADYYLALVVALDYETKHGHCIDLTTTNATKIAKSTGKPDRRYRKDGSGVCVESIRTKLTIPYHKMQVALETMPTSTSVTSAYVVHRVRTAPFVVVRDANDLLEQCKMQEILTSTLESVGCNGNTTAEYAFDFHDIDGACCVVIERCSFAMPSTCASGVFRKKIPGNVCTTCGNVFVEVNTSVSNDAVPAAKLGAVRLYYRLKIEGTIQEFAWIRFLTPVCPYIYRWSSIYKALPVQTIVRWVSIVPLPDDYFFLAEEYVQPLPQPPDQGNEDSDSSSDHVEAFMLEMVASIQRIDNELEVHIVSKTEDITAFVTMAQMAHNRRTPHRCTVFIICGYKPGLRVLQTEGLQYSALLADAQSVQYFDESAANGGMRARNQLLLIQLRNMLHVMPLFGDGPIPIEPGIVPCTSPPATRSACACMPVRACCADGCCCSRSRCIR